MEKQEVTEHDVRRVMARQQQQEDLRNIINELTTLILKVDDMLTHPHLSIKLEDARSAAKSDLLELTGFFETDEHKHKGLS